MIRAQYAVLTEFAREGARGKMDLLGVFDRVFAARVPAQHPQLVFVALIVADSEDDLGRKSVHFQCTRPTGQVLFEQQGEMELRPAAGTWLASGRLVFQVQGLPLPDWGKYLFTLQLDGR
ncbi:MAG TPA: hypothetical protein VH833_09440, partial [Gemmatimonadales bacterium]